VFLDIEKDFDATRHSRLLYKLPELEFTTNLIKLIASFLADREIKFLMEGEFSTPEKFRLFPSIVHSVHN
jgi:hypothetical protein